VSNTRAALKMASNTALKNLRRFANAGPSTSALSSTLVALVLD